MESAHLNRRRDGLSHRLLIRICMRAVSNGDTHNHILQFKQIHEAIWTNVFSNLNKYFLQFEQIHTVSTVATHNHHP